MEKSKMGKSKIVRKGMVLLGGLGMGRPPGVRGGGDHGPDRTLSEARSGGRVRASREPGRSARRSGYSLRRERPRRKSPGR
jgi:hypothetical protein